MAKESSVKCNVWTRPNQDTEYPLSKGASSGWIGAVKGRETAWYAPRSQFTSNDTQSESGSGVSLGSTCLSASHQG